VNRSRFGHTMRRYSTDWHEYDKCPVCQEPNGKPCLDMRMPHAIVRNELPHKGRKKLPKGVG
jgi:hypothetical protein